MTKLLIVFVCYGNIHRSPIAEHIMQKLLEENGLQKKFDVISCGIQGTKGTPIPKHKNLTYYPMIYNASLPVLKELGIDLRNHSYKPITKKIMDKASIVIAMERHILFAKPNGLLLQFPNRSNKMRLLMELAKSNEDILDCGESDDAILHRKTIETINTVLQKHYKKLLSWAKNNSSN